MITRVSLEEPRPPEGVLGSVCPHGNRNDHGSPVALIPPAPAGPQQLAHDGDVK